MKISMPALVGRCKQVIKSCKTISQLTVAKRYCQLARNSIMYSDAYRKEKITDKMNYHNKIQNLIWWLDYKIKQK